MSAAPKFGEWRKIHFCTQLFKPGLEQAFKQHLQVQLPMRCVFVLVPCLAIAIVFRLSASSSTSQSSKAHLLLLPIPVLVAGALTLSLAAWKGWLPKCVDLEYIMVATFTISIVFIPLNDPWRLALLLGKNPYEYWRVEHLEDTRLFAAMSGTVASVMSVLPLRASLSWPIPLAGAVSYTLTTVWLGAPGGVLTEWSATSPLHSHIILAVMFWLAWNGRAALEAAERRLFLNFLSARHAAYRQHFRAEKKKQQTVQERIKRFNAERELDKARGTWQPTSSGNVATHDGRRIQSHDRMQMGGLQEAGYEDNLHQLAFIMEEESSTDTQEQIMGRAGSFEEDDLGCVIEFGAMIEAMNRNLDSAYAFCTTQPEHLASNQNGLVTSPRNANFQERSVEPGTSRTIVSSGDSVV